MKYVRYGGRLVPLQHNPKKGTGKTVGIIAGLAVAGAAIGVGAWYLTQSSAPPGGCNPPCPSGYVCSGGVCVPSGVCSSNADCPPGYTCVSGQCQSSVGSSGCASNTDCPTGQYCNSGVCENGCRDDTNCTTGYHCISGTCVGCNNNNDCTTGYDCVNHQCVVAPAAVPPILSISGTAFSGCAASLSFVASSVPVGDIVLLMESADPIIVTSSGSVISTGTLTELTSITANASGVAAYTYYIQKQMTQETLYFVAQDHNTGLYSNPVQAFVSACTNPPPSCSGPCRSSADCTAGCNCTFGRGAHSGYCTGTPHGAVAMMAS